MPAGISSEMVIIIYENVRHYNTEYSSLNTDGREKRKRLTSLPLFLMATPVDVAFTLSLPF
jgi:hypothetical protein